MRDPGQSGWIYREKIKKMRRDRVNGKGSAASFSAVPRRGRCSGGACSWSCSPPKASKVEPAGNPQAPIFGRRETSDTPLGATRVLDRGSSILIAVEDHVGGGGGGGGGECSYQAPEAGSVERPQNSRAISQGHGHDKKKKEKTNDAADTVATSSSTVPGNLFPTAGPVAAPAETPIRGIRHRNGKFVVEIRVAKKKLLGFDKISLGSYCTREQASVARFVGDYYCGKWPPDCVISDPRILSSLPPLDPQLPPNKMKEQIQEIARWATLGCCTSAGTVPLWTHPGRGLINAAAAAPVQDSERFHSEMGGSNK